MEWEIGNETWSSRDYRDNWPFIWKQYQEAGYMTFYGEDWQPSWNLFDSGKSRGFKENPADHFMRFE
ncbi:MAG: DUF229 domain-containing protein [Gammaproteobacteria bacterium]|nr:DUF229 domain-containing protein [Gammaproteobacteria bacterium]